MSSNGIGLPLTVCEAFQRTRMVDPDAVAFRTPGGAVAVTWAQYDSRVRAVAEGIAAANDTLSRVEQIKRHRILDSVWEAGGDELTPTLKLRRKPISEKYAVEIDELYSSGAVHTMDSLGERMRSTPMSAR
ncbi:hypothetical protein [Rhodococcoides fascians]|uniref:hypothetical protein n=1 Tax=Rhodococcoides fascians TaxID=1828 RepID=UPI0018AF5498|nr:hypothetical protein [Rhodococcus fascians]